MFKLGLNLAKAMPFARGGREACQLVEGTRFFRANDVSIAEGKSPRPKLRAPARQDDPHKACGFVTPRRSKGPYH
jgi:hypothetical protein